MIYTGPGKNFTKEDAQLAKIQIDNSLSLGWKREDIIIATDFPFEYNGVHTLIAPDGLYYEFDKNANKVPVILYLINQNIIKPGEIYWCHDFDAYELNKISKEELGLPNYDLGLVHYFYKPEWSFSNFFFKVGAKDIFEILDKTIRERPWKSRNNEKTLTWLIKHNKIDKKRYKKLNVTYNIAKRSLKRIYAEAEKPLKILHFRPSDRDILMPDTALNMFMYGKNDLKIPLMNERLIKIFKYHHVR